MKRKAQISHVFTYLIIAFVIGLIVIFGYKGVMNILKAGCEHQRISFEKNLLGFIEEYSDKGSVHEELMNAPCKVREVCFVDTIYYNVSVPLNSNDFPDEVILSSVNTGRENSTTYNIFVRTKFTEPVAFSNKVALNESDHPYKCFNATSAGFKLLFLGLGRRTRIESDWET